MAPVDGIVSKNAEVGMNVQPGQQLFTIVPLDSVWFTANFKETQLKLMRPGQRAKIHLDANGRDYKGHVDSIAGSSGARTSLLPPENATGNYVKVVQRVPVKILFDEPLESGVRLGPVMKVMAGLAGLALVAVGADALIRTAMDAVRPGGRVMLFASTQHGEAKFDPAVWKAFLALLRERR